MGEIILKGYLCERCKHKWPPRNTSNQKPFVCPKCKSPYWNIPRKNNSKSKKEVVRMNKKGIVKAGIAGIFVFLLILFILVVLSSVFSSAILSKEKYAFGEKVKINLEGVENYKLKITTPSTTYVMEGNDEVFIFKPDEIGVYNLNLQYGGKQEKYEFEVVDEEKERTSEDNKIDDSVIINEPVYNPKNNKTAVDNNTIISIDDNLINDSFDVGLVSASDEQQIIINKPVKWTVNESIPLEIKKVKIKIPVQAENVSVSKITSKGKEKIDSRISKNVLSNTFSRIVSLNKDLGDTTLTIENPGGDIELEYYTPAPEVKEKRLSENKKQVVVSSPAGLRYENVTSYTNIPEITAKKDLIEIYWKEENRFLDFEAFDTDNNGLLDYVEWIVPHLSEQTFEISVSILNVQSYPVVGGTWEVRFVTQGKSDLYIRGFNGTLFERDLEFLELKCGSEVIEYAKIENGIFVEDYECSNTGIEVSKVITEGKHALEFSFGNEKSYAFNEASPYQIIGEWGTITNLQEGSWSTVNFNTTFNDTPVVVHQVDYDYTYDNNPCSTRIRNVNTTGFQIRAESWSPTASCPGTGVNAYWLAMEKGTYSVANAGTVVRTVEIQNFTMSTSACGSGAGTPNTWNYALNLRNFQNSWSFQPLVLGSVQTANDNDVITHYIKGCNLGSNTDTWNTTCVQIGLNGMENDGATQPCNLHTSDEEGGYIAWEMDANWANAESRDNNGTFGNGLKSFYWEAFWESDNVAGTGNDASPLGSYSVTLTQSWSQGTAFGSGLRIDGVNGILPTLDYDSGSNIVYLVAEEDEYGDAEQSHTAEPWQVLFFNASSGFIYSNVSNPLPQISNVNATSITDSSTTITWNTDTTGNSTVNYGTTLLLGSSQSDSGLVLNHSLLISGLNANTFYYYNVTSCSGPQLCNTTGVFNFTTISGTPPTIYNITPANNSNVSSPVTLSASTSEDANCEYNTTGTFVYGTGTNFTAGQGTSFHSTSLGSLSSGTYTYYIKCEDMSSNANDDSTQGMTTFTVDDDAPTSTLHYPIAGQIDYVLPTTFNWTTTDNLDATPSCDLYVDESLQESSIASSNNSVTSTSATTSFGVHNWSLQCFDDVNNSASETNWFYFGQQTQTSTIGEIGRTEVNASDWKLVTLSNSFITPVIVTGYEFPFDNTVPPVSVRMRNVSSTQFEIILQIANSTASASDVGNLNVTYLVVEQGFHYMEDGTRIEAYRYDTSTVSSSGNGWSSGDSKTYNLTYTTAPIVLHQVMTNTDANWITTFASANADALNPPTTTGFQISLNGAEYANSHGTETVGYVVIEINNGTNNGVLYEEDISGDIVEGVDNDPSCTSYSIALDNNYSSSPISLSAIQTMDGSNGGWSHICSISTTQVNVRVEEDELNDDERTHITEDVGIFVFESAGTIYSNITLSIPQISNVNATSISDSSATIVWNTNITSNSTVYYGLTNGSYFTKSSSSFVLNHSLQPTSLSENRTYFYVVESCSQSTGTCNFSGNFNFTTLTGTPPVIFNITPANSSIAPNPVTLSASTSENANCQYNTTETFVYGTGTNFTTGQGTVFHSTSLGTLGEGTNTYYIKCEDMSSNANDDSTQGSTTFSIDETSPSITLHYPDNGASNLGNTITFNFTSTDNMANSFFCNITIDSIVKESNINVTSGQVANSTQTLNNGFYNWNVTCADNSNNVNTSETRTFTVGADILVNVSADNSQYNQGQTATITVNTTDLSSSSLQTNTTTDIILGLSLANSTIWWNSSWQYRQAFRIQENSGTALNSYQINISLDTQTLISQGNLNSDCSDIRIIDNSLTRLDFYIQNSSYNGCNTTITQIWVKLSSLAANKSTLIYAYYGNSSAASLSSEYKTFNYTSSQNLYYVVSGDITNVDIISFVDGNNVSNGTGYVSLNRGAVTSFTVNQTSIISSTGPIFAAGDGNAVDALVPVSFAGTEFVYAVNRYNDVWHVYSPFGNAQVCVYDGNDGTGWTLVSTCVTVNQNTATTITRNVGGTTGTADAANTDTAYINSTLPVLIIHDTDSSTDAFTLYPASTDWWGVPSTRMTIGILEDSTTVQVYYSNGTNVNYSRSLGEDIYREGFSTGGQGSAVHIISNNPVGVAQEADQDGSEMTTFLPEFELGTEYFIPQTASYIAVSATYPSTNCTLYNDVGGVLSSSLTGSNSRPLPNKWYYGPDTTGNNIPAGSRLECSEPVFAYYEQFGAGGDDDEHNLWSIKSSRKFTYQGPTQTGKGNEERFIERNASETNGNGTYSFIFNTTSRTIGNYTAVTLAERSAYNNGTGQINFEILPPISQQAPNVTLTNPGNNTFQNTSTIIFYYNATDINGNIANSTLILDGQINMTNQTTITDGQINNFTITLSDGVYTWTVNVTDLTNFVGTDTNARTFTIDTLVPNITLYNPLANESFSSSTMIFNFSVTDNLDSVMVCDLIVDSIVEENNFNAQNDTFVNFTKTYGAGTHFWNVTCIDDASNTGISETRNFTMTDEPPTVALITSDNSFTSTGNITLEYNATDNNGLLESRLILNTQINLTNQSAILNGGISNFTLTGLAEGVYTWTVNVTDTASLNATALSERTFTVDLNDPVVNLNLPVDNDTSSSSSYNFNFTVNDTIDNTLTCDLYVGEISDLGFSATNGSLTNRNVAGLTDGQKTWNVTCLDDSGRSGFSGNRIIEINESPTITLNTANNSFYNTTIFNLSYTPSDNTNLNICELYLDSVFNQTNQSAITNGQQHNFSISGISEGAHTWYVSCNDTINLQNQSETRTFTVDLDGLNVSLLYPPSGLEISSDTVEFSYNATDNIDPTLSCDILVDSVVEDSFNATNAAITNRTVVFSQGGFKLWNVTCTDDSSNTVLSETRNFTLAFAPSVTLNSPANNTFQNTSTINLFYDVQDDNNNLANATLILSGQKNQTNQSIVVNEATNNFTITLSDGVYTWTVNVTDNTNLVGTDTNVRTFTIDTTSPSITLNQPENNSVQAWNNYTINFSVVDNLDTLLGCSVYVNSALNVTLNATNGTETITYNTLPDGLYLWNVSCLDDANNIGWSTTYNFTMEAPPNVTLNSPQNEYYFNISSIDFRYFVDDPIGINNCTLYINDTFADSTSEPSVGAENTFTVNNLGNGHQNWTVECFDASPDFNFFRPTVRNFTVDTVFPEITLNTPLNNTNVLRTVDFNFTTTDNLDMNLSCNLYTDGILNVTNISVLNGTSSLQTIEEFSLGLHSWNVSCADNANNINWSETRDFNVTLADLMVNTTSIQFNNTSPTENETVLINATVYNLENVTVPNVIVQFYDGDPDVSGTQIGSNQTISSISPLGQEIVSVEWQANLGTSDIFVIVDPLLASNGNIEEWNESNNEANKSIAVGGWHFLYGDINSLSKFELASLANSSVIKWDTTNFGSGNLYVTDSESSISWTNLQAIGKDTSDVDTSNDFTDIDTLLNMTGFVDSVTNTYTNSSGSIMNRSSFIIFNRIIDEVPVANSTNNTNFVTGILWDTSDDSNSEFDTSNVEDLIFITSINKDKSGAYGTYDYEIRIPAKLREYKDVESRKVVFYSELN